MTRRLLPLALVSLCVPAAAPAQVLDPQALLDAQTFWDNRDWNWYRATIPFFECPDPEITTTYYYRWELVTKHLTYGSPESGYSFTEFIDRPFWSGAYGAISCPAGHQLYEVRWLRDPRYARDYGRYWFRTPGAQPRNYSTWLADAVWAVHLVHPDPAYVKDLLPDLVGNYEAWEKRQFVPEVGLFWQNGHDDGMEFNINSRQTKDILRGAPGYRPNFNAYMGADAQAIARAADLAGDAATAGRFRAKADGLKTHLQTLLWDPKRQFFFHMFKQDETANGFTVQAMSLTHQTGQFAGNPHGRELIGYVPWQFDLPDAGFEAAWRFLMSKDHFYADYGPLTVERHDPLFKVTNHCCWWSGQSWPYATTQTLKAMANLLQNYRQPHVTKADYARLLKIYTMTHRKQGKPYLAEGANPDTGSWEGYDGYHHSEHYFHSGYNDLVITGLAGVRPRADDAIEVDPLAPEDWPYFALDDLPYHGRRVSILWDRDGSRYRRGAGLHILVDGKTAATSPRLGRLEAMMPPPPPAAPAGSAVAVNYAVNNDGRYFPRLSASFTAPKTSLAKVNDGNYWYHLHPPNRWTTEGSPNASDWVAADFGVERSIREVRLFLLDDGDQVAAPARIELQRWDGTGWTEIPGQKRTPADPAGHRANRIVFPALAVTKLRAVFTHGGAGRTGLTELEAWGDATLPIPQAPPPAGNLACNPSGKGFPRASASHTSRFDRVEMANDGVISLAPSPHNRWTSYESKSPTDWLEIDFGAPKAFSRVELYLYDDRGGVQVPADYGLETWDGSAWQPVPGARRSPERPAAGDANTVTFPKLQAPKLRVVFTHQGNARSGVSEILVWAE